MVEFYIIFLSIVAELFVAKTAGYTFIWTTYEIESSTLPIKITLHDSI